MGNRSPKDLGDLLRWDAHLRVTCQTCGRSSVYDTKQVLGYFHSRAWNTTWSEIARKFRCEGDRSTPGCGKRNAVVAMEPRPQPPSFPVPQPTTRDLRHAARRRR